MFVMLIGNDTIVTDTVQTYEIPTIITLWFYPETARAQVPDMQPVKGDDRLIETFFLSPFALLDYGGGQLSLVSRKGMDPRHTTLFLNGHRIDNPLLGYVNLAQLSPHPVDNISTSDHRLGSTCINIASRVNQYTTPFSFVQFTWGDFETNVYNVGLTRPITNDLGFYLNGSYVETAGYRINSQYDLSSLYSNMYYNVIIPLRMDIMYASGEYGMHGGTLDSLQATGKNDFGDVALVFGNDSHRAALYYTVNRNDYRGMSTDSLYANVTRNYGIDINNQNITNGYTIAYQLMGVVSGVKSDFVGEHTLRSLNARAAIQKSYRTVSLALGAHTEWYDERELLYAPHVTADFFFSDAARLSAQISRNFRNPSLLELYGPTDIPHVYNWTGGNSTLLPEYVWQQEISLCWSRSSITLYRHDYKNMIVPCCGETSIPRNVASWQRTGMEGYIMHVFHLAQDTSTQSNTAISAGLSGNYTFTGDSLLSGPESYARGFVAFMRETRRFGLELIVRAEYVGRRWNELGHDEQPFTVLSAIAHIRFITLSFSIHFDNVLNESYAYIDGYENAPRNERFSITWEFWD